MLITKDDYNYYEISETIYVDDTRYDLGEKIGSGGNSSVYECFDNKGESFAIKFQLNLSDKSVKRFLQEVKLHRQLNHPNFIKYIDSGEIDSKRQLKNGKRKCKIPFIIMEKAEMNLSEYLIVHNKILYSEYIRQFLGLAEALAKLHEIAIHRDLKLANILVIGERWVIGDFGLCSFLGDEHEDITCSDEKVGPKYWMSPEAINKIYDSSIDIVPASDVFQLSAIFWFVVTSKYPLGIVSKNDWNADDLNLGNVLINGLLHNTSKRIQNGSEMFSKLSEVIDSNRRKKTISLDDCKDLINIVRKFFLNFINFFSKKHHFGR